MADSWPEVLDRLEKSIRDHEDALVTGSYRALTSVLPTDLGPVPEELADRAMRIFRELEALEEKITEARNSVAALLSLAEGAVPAAATPYYVDTSA